MQLATFLRLAESLERGRAGRILDLAVKIKKKRVLVTLSASEQPMIELWEANKHADLFSRAFDRDLDLRAEINRAGAASAG